MKSKYKLHPEKNTPEDILTRIGIITAVVSLSYLFGPFYRSTTSVVVTAVFFSLTMFLPTVLNYVFIKDPTEHIQNDILARAVIFAAIGALIGIFYRFGWSLTPAQATIAGIVSGLLLYLGNTDLLLTYERIEDSND